MACRYWKLFYYTHPQIKINCASHLSFNIRNVLSFFSNLFLQNFLIQHDDIESNPGPNRKHKPLACCHWNANSLAAHKFLKKSSIEAYNSIHNYGFICISETYLHSTTNLDDKDLAIEGYNIIRPDHPNNLKKGECIYYKESLAVKLINVNFLSECLVCEVTLDNKRGYITVLYRSPSQNSSEFDNFLSGLETCLISLILLNQTFQLSLGILMPDQNLSGIKIQIRMKVLKLTL